MSFAERVSSLANRLRARYRSQGLSGLAAFLGTRVFQRREDLLYELRLDESSLSRLGEPLADVLVVGRENLGSEVTDSVARQILEGENLAYVTGLKSDDLMFAHVDHEGRVDTYAFVLFDTQYKRVLRVARATPLIGNCYTQPERRGRGLYPGMLRAVSLDLARRGFQTVTVSCAPDNFSSIKGIERAGFCLIRRMTTWVLLSRIVLRRRWDGS